MTGEATVSADALQRTTWAACMLHSVSGEFPDEAERRELAQLAQVLGEGQPLDALDLDQTNTAVRALIAEFGRLPGGQARGQHDGQLAASLTPERVALAHATLCVQSGRLLDERDDLYATLIASVALSLFRFETMLVMTPEVREERRSLVQLKDALEGLLMCASPLHVSEAESYLLRQSLIASINTLTVQPGLVERLQAMDDLRERLTAPHLNAAYQVLIMQRHSAGEMA